MVQESSASGTDTQEGEKETTFFKEHTSYLKKALKEQGYEVE